MTKIELSALRKGLEKRRAELEAGNHSRAALVVERSSDELDRIQHGQQRYLAIDLLDRNSKLLREVRAALSRIEGGKFGIPPRLRGPGMRLMNCSLAPPEKDEKWQIPCAESMRGSAGSQIFRRMEPVFLR
jgi:hypothetical protein